MRRSTFCAIALVVAGWSVTCRAAVADIVLQNDSQDAVFVRATDNNSPTLRTSVQVRLDPGVGSTVLVNLDAEGNYYVTWTTTDPADPPTKAKSGPCRGDRAEICNVDLLGATPLPLQRPASPPGVGGRP
jgi:hypothetical protein